MTENEANIIRVLEENRRYREIGTLEELQTMKEHGGFTGVELAQIAAMQMKLKEYEAIGTPEECRAAVEKQTAKKPSQDSLDGLHYFPTCPSCGYGLDEEDRESYCECGQKLDWSDVE